MMTSVLLVFAMWSSSKRANATPTMTLAAATIAEIVGMSIVTKRLCGRFSRAGYSVHY